MKKIGILGGTFDPIHNGHIELAKTAKEQYLLDEIWFMPSPDPPHKLQKSKSPYELRYKMTKVAIEGINGFICTDYEAKLPQPSYTANTLENLKKDFPDNEFFFIIGEDSLDMIETWYMPEKIMLLTTLIVAARKEDFDNRSVEEQVKHLEDKYSANIKVITWNPIDISSTELRERVKKRLSIKDLVPEKVEEIIWTEKIYTR